MQSTEYWLECYQKLEKIIAKLQYKTDEKTQEITESCIEIYGNDEIKLETIPK